MNPLKVLSYWYNQTLDVPEDADVTKLKGQEKQNYILKNVISNVIAILDLYPSLFHTTSVIGILRILHLVVSWSKLREHESEEIRNFADSIIVVKEYTDKYLDNFLVFDQYDIFMEEKPIDYK